MDEKNELNNISNTEEELKKSNKKSNIFLIVVMLLLLIGVGVGGFFLGRVTANKESKNEKNETEKNNNNEKQPNVEKPENNISSQNEDIIVGKKLIEDITAFGSIDDKEYYSDQILYYANDKKVEASSLNHELVYQIVLDKFYSNDPKEISLNDFNNKVKELIDDSYSFVAKDYFDRCSGHSYKLDGNKYYKVPSYGGCGGAVGYNRAPYKVTSILKDANCLVVKVKVLFGKMIEDNSVVYYSDYANTKLINGANQDNYENYLDEGTIYKFTFTNKNDNYLFYSSEIN